MLLFTQCKKEEEESFDYYVEGVLYDNCNNDPVEGQNLDLYHESLSVLGLTHRYHLGGTVTGKKGYFRIGYNTRSVQSGTNAAGAHDDLAIITENAKVLMQVIPINEVLPGLTLYNNTSRDVDFYLQVNQAYTSQDTLFYGPEDRVHKKSMKLAGPFQDQFLFTKSIKIQPHYYDSLYPLAATSESFRLEGPTVWQSPKNEWHYYNMKRCGPKSKQYLVID